MNETFYPRPFRHPKNTWHCPVCGNSSERKNASCPGMTQEERDLASGSTYLLLIGGGEIKVDILKIQTETGVVYARDRWSMFCPSCHFEWDAT